MFAYLRRRAVRRQGAALPERRAVIRGNALALGPATVAAFSNHSALISEEAEPENPI